MNDNIILSADDFKKIFANAYAVVVDGVLYDVYNDYETEDGELCTAFVLADDSHCDVEFVIPRSVEENSRVSYNKRYHEFHFEGQDDIPAFKILTVATIA
ncbi:MAG: hypothetical protein IJ341_12870 [Bacteroidales bacterium]|nr:hypothetical protein [Bacteroidales bacterium]